MEDPTRLALPPGWTQDGKRASIEVRTRCFRHAADLVDRIARVADALDHHPDVHIERYDRLRVTTWSHDVGRLTTRDERLARAIHEILEAEGVAPRA